MILRDNLYKIVAQHSSDEHNVTYDVRLNPDCEIYKAHFPGEPITPGVCIVQIVQELFADYVCKSANIKCVKNVKFVNVISPIECSEIRVSIKYTEVNDFEYNMQSVIKKITDDVCAKISIICQTH